MGIENANVDPSTDVEQLPGSDGANTDSTPGTGSGGEGGAEEPLSRKDLIAAAFEASEQEADQNADKGTEQKPTEQKKSVQEGAKPADAGKPVEGEAKPTTKVRDPSATAPATWKPEGKAAWKDVPLVARQEILRRDRETAQVLSQTESLRNFAGAMGGVLNPHMPRLQSLGVQPHVAVEKLLRSDMVLSTAPMAQRAQFMAKLISDYGIDIGELDRALQNAGSGTPGSADPNMDGITRILQQELAPVRQFMQTQAQRTQQQEQQENNQLMSEVDQMAADDVKYPYFQEVREDMADIVELSAKKGVYVTMAEAYNKACQLNPAVAAEMEQARLAEQRRIAAVGNDTRARRAIAASRSITGSSSGAPTGSLPGPTDRRGTIAAAFDSLGGR